MNNVHFAIPEIYGETLSYYELLRKLVDKTNDLIDNYNTVPEQIAEEVKKLDAYSVFTTALNWLIHSIATDNTKSTNAVKQYKKHELLYATFNDTVNLYEAITDFTNVFMTELKVGENIREVNISELFIELWKLIDVNKNNIESVTAVANGNSEQIETINSDITSIKNKNNEQDNELSTLRTMLSSPYNFKGEVANKSALPASGEVNDTYYVQDVKYKVTWTGSAWVQSSLSEADYQTELSELKSDLANYGAYKLYGNGFISSDGLFVPSDEFRCYKFVINNVSKIYVKNAYSNNQFVHYIAFVAKNERFISGLINTNHSEDLINISDIPSDAYYCYVTYASNVTPIFYNSDKEIQLYGLYKDTEDKIKATEDKIKATEDKIKATEDKIKATEDKIKKHTIIEVGVNKQFTTIMSALNSIQNNTKDNIFDVYLYEGTYDIVTERNNTRYYLPDYVNIIGIGNKDRIIIKGDMDSSVGASVIDQVSVFDVIHHNKIENVTLTAHNCRYVIHTDDYVADSNILFKNCKMVHYGIDIPTTNNSPCCVGSGTYDNKKLTFIDCDFTSYNCCAWTTHNRNNGDSQNTKNVFITLENCNFINIINDSVTHDRPDWVSKHSLTVQSWGSNMKENLTIVGCSCNIDMAHALIASNKVDYDVHGHSNNFGVCYINQQGDFSNYFSCNYFEDIQSYHYLNDSVTYGDCVKLNENGSVSKMTENDSTDILYGLASMSGDVGDVIPIQHKGLISTYSARVSEKNIGTKIRRESGNLFSVTDSNYDFIVKKYGYIEI